MTDADRERELRRLERDRRRRERGRPTYFDDVPAAGAAPAPDAYRTAETLTIPRAMLATDAPARFLGVSDRLELVLYSIHHRLELPPPPAAAV